MTTTQSLADQLNVNGPWYCPNVDSYTLLNKGEITITAFIDTCAQVQTLLGDKADTSITCETDTSVIEAYIDMKVYVGTQFLTEYFNLEQFVASQTLDYVGLMPAINPISVHSPESKTYVVQSTKVDIFMARFIDLSSFSFFNFGFSYVTY